MLKKISIRKIFISLSALFAMFLIYIIPTNNKDYIEIKQKVEYVDKDIKTATIYLLDSYSMLGKTDVSINSDKIEDKSLELLQILINGGIGEDKIPSGFKSILPSETKINNIKYEKNTLKINFNENLLDISEELEEKVIESIVYTLTSIDGVDNIIIYINDQILTKLPKTKINLPSTLDRSFGINKEYDITSSKNINQVTIYYINKNNDNYYYVPVTKYLNDDRDKIKIVVDELSSNPVYNTNLMSFLNSNTKLLKVEQSDNALELNFNEYILNDVDKQDILEEVIYTICLSIYDNYDVEDVILKVNDKEIYKSVSKTIE